MIKKISLGLLFVVLSGALVVGAVNRTQDRTDKQTDIADNGDRIAAGEGNRGQGLGQNALENERRFANTHEPLGRVDEQGGQGNRGQIAQRDVPLNGSGEQPLGFQRAQDDSSQELRRGQQGRGQAGLDTAPYFEEKARDMLIVEGVVQQVPAPGVELLLLTDEGEVLTIGAGPSQWLEQGLILEAGEQIQVEGYWENDEFKAAAITTLTNMESLVLRDESGRPLWSGGAINGRGQGNGGRQGQGVSGNNS